MDGLILLLATSGFRSGPIATERPPVAQTVITFNNSLNLLGRARLSGSQISISMHTTAHWQQLRLGWAVQIIGWRICCWMQQSASLNARKYKRCICCCVVGTWKRVWVSNKWRHCADHSMLFRIPYIYSYLSLVLWLYLTAFFPHSICVRSWWDNRTTCQRIDTHTHTNTDSAGCTEHWRTAGGAPFTQNRGKVSDLLISTSVGLFSSFSHQYLYGKYPGGVGWGSGSCHDHCCCM